MGTRRGRESDLHPTLIEVPLWRDLSLVFPSYGSLLVMGFLVAFLVGRRGVLQIGLSSDELFNMGYLAVLAGIFGSHLVHVALHPASYFETSLANGLWRTLAFWQGGLSYYGGLAGGILALTLYARRKGVATIDVLDFVAPLGALGLSVTRGGCFLNGCCFGRPSEVAWAVSFPVGSPAQLDQTVKGMVAAGEPSLPVHPTQLYELVAAAAIFTLLWAAWPRRRFRGQIVLLFFLLYAPWRFAIEFLRADSAPWRPWGVSLTGLNVYQVTSVVIFLVAAGLWLLANVRRKAVEREGAVRQ